MKSDLFFMRKAFLQAQKAYAIDEVPIGAILVDQRGTIIAQSYNQIEKKKSQLAHAEMVVLQKAAKKIKNWRLQHTTLYVTVQPCMMCLGALYLSRVSRVVYGAESYKFGMTLDTALTKGIYKNLSLKLEYMEYNESANLLNLFFQKKRRKKNVEKNGARAS